MQEVSASARSEYMWISAPHMHIQVTRTDLLTLPPRPPLTLSGQSPNKKLSTNKKHVLQPSYFLLSLPGLSLLRLVATVTAMQKNDQRTQK